MTSDDQIAEQRLNSTSPSPAVQPSVLGGLGRQIVKTIRTDATDLGRLRHSESAENIPFAHLDLRSSLTVLMFPSGSTQVVTLSKLSAVDVSSVSPEHFG